MKWLLSLFLTVVLSCAAFGQSTVQIPADSQARAWIYATQSAGTYTTQASFNASQSKTGTGLLNLTWSPAFSSTTSYGVVCTGQTGNTPSVAATNSSASVTAIELRASNTTTLTDFNFFCVAYGR